MTEATVTQPTHMSLAELFLVIFRMDSPMSHIKLMWRQCHYIVNEDAPDRELNNCTGVTLIRDLDPSKSGKAPEVEIVFSEPGYKRIFRIPATCLGSNDPRASYQHWALSGRANEVEAELDRIRERQDSLNTVMADLNKQLEDLRVKARQ